MNHMYAHHPDPARRETAVEQQDARLTEMHELHAVLDEFSAWFGGDLAEPDRADSEIALSEVRAVVAWLNAAPEDVREIALTGMKRTRAALGKYHRHQRSIEIMGEVLPPVWRLGA